MRSRAFRTTAVAAALAVAVMSQTADASTIRLEIVGQVTNIGATPSSVTPDEIASSFFGSGVSDLVGQSLTLTVEVSEDILIRTVTENDDPALGSVFRTEDAEVDLTGDPGERSVSSVALNGVTDRFRSTFALLLNNTEGSGQILGGRGLLNERLFAVGPIGDQGRSWSLFLSSNPSGVLLDSLFDALDVGGSVNIDNIQFGGLTVVFRSVFAETDGSGAFSPLALQLDAAPTSITFTRLGDTGGEPTDPISAIPLPASAWLLLSGIGLRAIGAARKRRKAA
jgi:hypothetical protein